MEVRVRRVCQSTADADHGPERRVIHIERTARALLAELGRSDADRIKHDRFPLPPCLPSGDLLRFEDRFRDRAEVQQEAANQGGESGRLGYGGGHDRRGGEGEGQVGAVVLNDRVLFNCDRGSSSVS